MREATPARCSRLSLFRGLQVKPAPDERQFVPGSATRVPAGRKCCDSFRGTATHRKQTRCATLFSRGRNLFVSEKKRKAGSIRLKEQTHGSRKTRHKAPGTAEEVSQKDQGLFSYQEQALPVRAGSGQSR